jgi:hypothetical protein
MSQFSNRECFDSPDWFNALGEPLPWFARPDDELDAEYESWAAQQEAFLPLPEPDEVEASEALIVERHPRQHASEEPPW